MRHHTAARTATAALLAGALLGACDGTQEESTDAGLQRPQESETPGADEETETPQVDGDLALGDTYTWDDGLSLAIDSLTEVSAADLGPYDYLPDGETAWTADLTIVNNSQEPIDLGDFSIVASGATTGGDATPVVLDGRTELLEGRLAAGETKESAMAWSFVIEEVGREVVIEAYRISENVGSLDPAVWVGTIS